MRAITNKKILIPSIIAVVALAGGGVYYLKNRADEPKPTAFVNLDPPTEEEKQQAEDNKDRIVKEQEEQASQPPPSNGGPKSVTPVITSAELYNGAIEVSGFVPGVFEDGGTCTATLTKGSSKITKQVQGVKNVSNTQCNGFSVPASELSAGTWSVTLAYSSATAQGSSAASTVEVK